MDDLKMKFLPFTWLIVLTLLKDLPTQKLSGVSGQEFYQSPYHMPLLHPRTYVKEGDIMIGVLTSISNRKSGFCEDTISNRAWENIERIVWPISQINNNSKILPNVTMGFVAMDTCGGISNALAASLAFLPRAPCDKDNFNSTPSYYYCPKNTNGNGDIEFPTYDVIGIVTPASSQWSVVLSYLHTSTQMPQMGYMSTSDELSNKAHHPYYFRVVPPDQHQVEAMLTFISDNDWSYISVIYSQGSYGENAFDHFKEKVGSFGVCIATHHRLVSSVVDYQQIAADLVAHSRARVVILFITSNQAKSIFEAVKKLNYLHHFVWIGSDAWSFNYNSFLNEHIDSVLGAFSFFPYSRFVSPYFEYLGQQTIDTSTNPFMKVAWEYFTDCSFVENTCDLDENIVLSKNFRFSNFNSLYFDAFQAFAHAADDLIKDKCPQARGKEVRNCITGGLLAEYLKNVSFQGYTEYIEFDQFNDVKGKYMILQLILDYQDNPYLVKMNRNSKMEITGKTVGVYDIRNRKIAYTSDNISWSHLNTLDRIVQLDNESVNEGRPESVCSGPCLEREYKILKEMPCCWECRRCRDNERLDVHNSTCRQCPLFTWPEHETGYQTCTTITLTFPKVRRNKSYMTFF